MSFSGTVSSGSTLFAILSILIRVYTYCHSQHSDQGLQYLPFSAVWSGSTNIANLIGRSASTRLASLSNLIKIKVHLSFSGTVWSGSTLFAILSSQIRVYTVDHSQQSDQGLHSLPSDESLQYLPLSAVWSGSTLFAILSSLIHVYTVCHFQQSDQSLHCLPFSAVWSGSTLFAILSSLIRVYTVCHSQHSHQGLHFLPFSAAWTVSTLFAILSILIKVYTICHSQQSDQGLH